MLSSTALLCTSIAAACWLIAANQITALWKLCRLGTPGDDPSMTQRRHSVSSVGDSLKSALQPKRIGDIPPALAAFVVSFGIAWTLTANAIAGKMLILENGPPLFALGVPTAALLVAAGAFALFVIERRRQKASESWPTTRGRITDSELVENAFYTRDTDRDDRTVRTWRPDIHFVYRVGDTDYANTTWKPGGTMSYGTKRFGEELVARYPAGQSVTVYYNPAHPGVAVLDPKNRDGSGLPVVFGVIFGVVGMVFMGLLIHIASANAATGG
jgi:hypothetical protein